MKFLHLSDLHLGKRLNDVSLAEDQEYILREILRAIDEETVDAVLLCGDIYDRSAPDAASVALFDGFLTSLAERDVSCLIIGGNHDSHVRLNYASSFLKRANITVAPAFDGETLSVEIGGVYFHLLPHVQPELVEGAQSTAEAVARIIEEMPVDPEKCNVILSHQFVAGGEPSDSERKSIVGTLENVPPDIFRAFDYVALGHLHKPQSVGRADGTMRYCGSPLKYSKSEAYTDKTLSVVELRGKGDIEIREIPLKPLRDVRVLRGKFDEIIREDTGDDYVYVVLTDEVDIPNAAARIRERIKNALEFEYDNSRTRAQDKSIEAPGEIAGTSGIEKFELFKKLYEQTNHTPLTEDARAYLQKTIDETEALEA